MFGVACEAHESVHGRVSKYIGLLLTGRNKEGCKGQGTCQGGGNCSGAGGHPCCCEEDKVTMKGGRLGVGATTDCWE